MNTLISADRLMRAKRAYTTRRVDTSVLTGVSQQHAPVAGDVVLARITDVGAHSRLELETSRKALLFAGDEVVLAFGNRYAPDQFEAYVPDDFGPCHLAAAGGVASRVVNKNARMASPTAIEPIGIFIDSEGRKVNLKDFALAGTAVKRKAPGFVVVGGSMNAGKTTTAAALVRGLTLAGRKVGAAKLTGTGAGNDFWHMYDAGAAAVLDFVDVGLVSTFRADRAELERVTTTLAAHLLDAGCDALVFEIADGLFQEETAWLVGSPVMSRLADAYLYAAESAASAAMGVQWLKHYARVLGVSGVVSASPLAARETEAATGYPCFTKEALASPRIAEGFIAAVSGPGATQAA